MPHALVKAASAAAAADVRTRASALVEAFFSDKKANTLRAYRRDLEDFRSFANAASVEEAAALLLSRGHGEANALALAYKADLRNRGNPKPSASTINRRLAALRSLVALGRTLGIVPWSLEVKGLKSKSYRDTQGPGRAGVRAMMDRAAVRDDAKGRRDRAALRLFHDLALRRGELAAMDIDDVDLKAGTVAVLGKDRNEKEVLSLPEQTREAIAVWLRARGHEPGPLFTNFDRARKGRRLTGTSLYRIIRDLGAEVGLKTRPHGIRHTAITEACKAAQANGINLEEVRDFSRHADVRTLMIYRDRERNVQGQLASLVAGEVGT
jgi:integrase/recombinase XerC